MWLLYKNNNEFSRKNCPFDSFREIDKKFVQILWDTNYTNKFSFSFHLFNYLHFYSSGEVLNDFHCNYLHQSFTQFILFDNIITLFDNQPLTHFWLMNTLNRLMNDNMNKLYYCNKQILQLGWSDKGIKITAVKVSPTFFFP